VQGFHPPLRHGQYFSKRARRFRPLRTQRGAQIGNRRKLVQQPESCSIHANAISAVVLLVIAYLNEWLCDRADRGAQVQAQPQVVLLEIRLLLIKAMDFVQQSALNHHGRSGNSHFQTE